MRLGPALALALAFAVASPAAHAIYACVNERGVKSYQDEPCVTKEPSAALAPLRADELNEKAVRETMRRYEEAMSTRDPVAVARLMSSGLKVNLKMLNKSAEVQDFWRFTETVKLVLNAYPHYKARHRCKPIKPGAANTLVLECVTDEEIQMQGQMMRGQANETFHFALEDGFVKIRQVDSVQVTELKGR